MTEAHKIYRAGPAQLETLVPLFDAYRVFYGQPSASERARSFLSERLTQNDTVVFLAERESKAVGFTQLFPSFSSVSLRRLWILNDLFVVPDARRDGVARALLERARAHAVETGAKGLMLSTAANNKSAQRLYEGLGWARDEAFYNYELIV